MANVTVWAEKTFKDNETVIDAAFLNGFQRNVIAAEGVVNGKVDKVSGKVLSTNDFTTALKNKLDALPTKATLDTSLAGKVDKVEGKGLSTNDYTDADKQKVDVVDTKAPVILNTASGDIASFPDGTDNMPIKSLVVTIEPVQEGSGDPSRDNIRPISGWTGADVGNRGKNLYNKDSVSKWGYLDENGAVVSVAANQGWTISDYIYIPHTILAYKGITVPGTAPRWCWYDKKKQFISSFSVAAGSGILTPPANAAFLRCSVIEQETSSTYDTYTLCIAARNTVGEYEAYKGQTLHITFPTSDGPVYGGTLDVISGKMRVTWACYNASEFASYAKGGSTTYDEYFFRVNSSTQHAPVAETTVDIICSHARPGRVSGAAYVQTRLTSSQPRLLFPVGQMPTLQDFSAWLTEQENAGKPVQFCYKLASPIERQLTPQEVTTLLGTNHVWTDVGPVEVTYLADTWTYLDNLTNGAMPFRSTLTESLFPNYCEAMDMVTMSASNIRSVKIRGNVVEASPLIDEANGSTYYSFVLNKPTRYVGSTASNFTPNLVADDFSRIHLTNAQRLIINLSILYSKAASSTYNGSFTSGALFAATYDPVTETVTAMQIAGGYGVIDGLERSLNMTTDITHLLPAIRDNGNICIIFQSKLSCIKEKWVIDLHIETDTGHNPDTLLYGTDYRNNTSVAEKNITAGTYIMQNGALLQATENIAVDTELAGKVSGKTLLGILNDFEARLRALE